MARLKGVVRELIDLERAQRREIAALQSVPAADRAAAPARRRARKKSAAAPAGPSAAEAPAGSSPEAGGAQQASGTAPASTGMLFGKRGLKKVHRAGCIFGERIKAEDRVYFKSMQEAAAAGYVACKICHPDR